MLREINERSENQAYLDDQYVKEIRKKGHIYIQQFKMKMYEIKLKKEGRE